MPCPKCGVAVPLGYVKCPRCHAAMPAAPSRARRESMRDSIAGGTAVETPEPGGFPWLLAGVCAAAAITAIVWYVSSGGARAAEPGAAAQPAAMPAAASGSALAAASDVEPPAAPVVDPRPRQRTDALAALAHRLESDQLWATVTEVGDAVELRSSFCADRGMSARIDAIASQLGTLGFTSVRCLEKGGTPVWKRDLR
jgi:hypothetical protein